MSSRNPNPGGEVDKSQFDGAGREIESYTPTAPAAPTWTAAGSVANDNVLEQTDTQYDSDGNAILVTTRQRDHNTTQAGALGNETTSPEARVYYVASYYDNADRLVDTVNVGTNGGTAYTRPGTVPTGSATVLVTLTILQFGGLGSRHNGTPEASTAATTTTPWAA